MNGGSVPANELRQVKQLLWNIISHKLNPVEVDEVRYFAFSFAFVKGGVTVFASSELSLPLSLHLACSTF